MITTIQRDAIHRLADVVGFDLEDGSCCWFAEPEGLEDALPGLPRALFDLFSAFDQEAA